MARSARVIPIAPTTVADTGAIYALLDRDDSWYQRIVAWWTAAPRRVVLPVSILAEVCYLLQTRARDRGAEARFLRAVAAGEFRIEGLEPADYPRIHELVQDFDTLPLGFVDASVLTVAERLGATEILTTDRRHFTVAKSANGAVVVP